MRDFDQAGRAHELLCIDLGRTDCKHAASGDPGQVTGVDRTSSAPFLSTQGQPNPHGYQNFLGFLAEQRQSRTDGLALAVPFAVDHAHGLLATVSEAGWPPSVDQVVEDCARVAGVERAVLVNDAVAFALGRMPAERTGFLALTLGTNYGCALVHGRPRQVTPVEVNQVLAAVTWPAGVSGPPSGALLRQLPFERRDARTWNRQERTRFSTVTGWLVAELIRRFHDDVVCLGGGRSHVVDLGALRRGIHELSDTPAVIHLDRDDGVPLAGTVEAWRHQFLSGKLLSTLIHPPVSGNPPSR